MKNWFNWLNRLFDWGRKMPFNPLYLWAVAGVAAAIFWVAAYGWTKEALQEAGLVLQLGGVLTVVGGISDTWAVFKHWVKQFPPYVPPTNPISINGTLPPFSGEMRMRPNAPVTIEERLGHLEDVVKNLAEQGKTCTAVLQKAQQALDAQASQLAGQINELKTSATRGFHISFAGAILIFFGTLSSGFA